MNSEFLWQIFWGTLLLIFIFVVVYCFSVIVVRHKHRKKEDSKICSSYEKLPDSIKTLFNSILDRRQSSIGNYIIFQTTTKVFGFTGVLYSICGFGLAFIEPPKELSILVSLTSLICVIIALYLSPEKRISEYISAWRRYDKLTTDMIGRFPFYDGKSGDCSEILDEVAKISKEVSEIEKAITSDEN